jgi:hypothetical protein
MTGLLTTDVVYSASPLYYEIQGTQQSRTTLNDSERSRNRTHLSLVARGKESLLCQTDTVISMPEGPRGQLCRFGVLLNPWFSAYVTDILR